MIKYFLILFLKFFNHILIKMKKLNQKIKLQTNLFEYFIQILIPNPILMYFIFC